MKRPTILLSPFALAIALSGLAMAAPAAEGQTGQTGQTANARTYAPERLWELPVVDQRRVIRLEYIEQSGGGEIPDDQMRFYLDQVKFSRWTFEQIRNDIGQSLTGGGSNPNPGGAGIRCESRDSREVACDTPWQRRSVLTRQLSDTRCVEGQNWSSTPGTVRVSGGCRGEFAAMQGGVDGAGVEVRCESADGRYKQCGTGLYGSPRLVRQLSDTACRSNTTFGLRDGALWVDQGCRGIFRVEGNGSGNGNGNGAGYSVTCSSANGKYSTCAWDRARGAPVLLQTLSGRPCTQGYSWGYTRKASLWVNHGCRARFGVR